MTEALETERSFPIGARVKLSVEGIAHGIRRRNPNIIGIVKGYSNDRQCIRVGAETHQGSSSALTYHKSFWTVISDTESP